MKPFGQRRLTANCRSNGSQSFVEVQLPGDTASTHMYKGIIPFTSGHFGEQDLKQVITQLEAQKDKLLKQRNYPSVFGEMLEELRDIVNVRYGGLPKE